jgi:HPr kinase/phosphorylase
VAATVHASAVLVGAWAVLVRGPAGSGKSRLTLALLDCARAGIIPFARLVADDRVYLEAVNGRLLARAPDALAGLIEVRGLGLRRLPSEPVARVGLVVDLAADDDDRLPPAQLVTIEGVAIPRLAVASGSDPLPRVVAALTSATA